MSLVHRPSVYLILLDSFLIASFLAPFFPQLTWKYNYSIPFLISIIYYSFLLFICLYHPTGTGTVFMDVCGVCGNLQPNPINWIDIDLHSTLSPVLTILPFLVLSYLTAYCPVRIVRMAAGFRHFCHQSFSLKSRASNDPTPST